MELTEELISTWKKQYGNIYSVGSQGFVVRALTIEEHSELLIHKEWSTVDAEDYIVFLTVLHPTKEELDKLPGGIFSSLAEEVLSISGFSDVKFAKQTMDAAREKANEVISLMKAFIIAAMPQYTDDTLNKFNFVQLANKVALAEKILEIKRDGLTLTLIDPEEEAKKAQAKERKEKAFKKPGQATSSDPIAQKLMAAMGEI